MELRPDLWHCADCGTAYAVGLTCCPQCSSTRRADAPEGYASGGHVSPGVAVLVGPETIQPLPPADDDEKGM